MSPTSRALISMYGENKETEGLCIIVFSVVNVRMNPVVTVVKCPGIPVCPEVVYSSSCSSRNVQTLSTVENHSWIAKRQIPCQFVHASSNPKARWLHLHNYY